LGKGEGKCGGVEEGPVNLKGSVKRDDAFSLTGCGLLMEHQQMYGRQAK